LCKALIFPPPSSFLAKGGGRDGETRARAYLEPLLLLWLFKVGAGTAAGGDGGTGKEAGKAHLESLFLLWLRRESILIRALDVDGCARHSGVI
jgi:hypothetical protein